MKTRTALTALAFIALAVAAPGYAEAPDPVDHATERAAQETRRAIRAMDRVDEDAIAWGQERKANRTTVIVLDPPLPKTLGPDTVEVEWFQSFVDRHGGVEIGSRTAYLVIGKWWANWWKAKIPVGLHVRPLGEGPQLDENTLEQRQWLQRLMLAWKSSTFEANMRREPGEAEMLSYLAKRAGNKAADAITTQKIAEGVVDAANLSIEEWRQRLDQPATHERIKLVDTRWAAIANQATKQYRKALAGIPDPVLLIDGKYLLTANTMRRHGGKWVERVFQTANWLIRHQMEQMPQHGFDMESFDTARKPRRGEVIRLKSGSTNTSEPEQLEVEWLYTYLTEDGRGTHRGWLDKTFDAWLVNVRERGKSVRFVRTPVTGTPRNPWESHQKVHQRLALAARLETKERWDRLPGSIDYWLRGNSKGLSTEEEVGMFLLSGAIPADRFQEHAESPEMRAAVNEANEKARSIRGVLEAKGLASTEPWLLINRRWVLTGATTGSTNRVFQILNWLVDKS